VRLGDGEWMWVERGHGQRRASFQPSSATMAIGQLDGECAAAVAACTSSRRACLASSFIRRRCHFRTNRLHPALPQIAQQLVENAGGPCALPASPSPSRQLLVAATRRLLPSAYWRRSFSHRPPCAEPPCLPSSASNKQHHASSTATVEARGFLLSSPSCLFTRPNAHQTTTQAQTMTPSIPISQQPTAHPTPSPHHAPPPS
jgi:hypothetical protein